MPSGTVSEEAVIERKVKPVGRLLNDNDSGVDQLGYLVYAQALSKLLHNCNPPISIGVFGPWGIGKTFLLKHVQCLLRKYEQQENYDIACTSSSDHLDNYTEEDGQVKPHSGRRKSDEPTPSNRTRGVNLRRACINHCATLFAFLLFGAACAVLLLLIYSCNPPGIDETGDVQTSAVGRQYKDGKSRSRNAVEKIGNFTSRMRNGTGLTLSITTEAMDAVAISQNLRIYLILLLVCLTGMVFAVFCCCITNTSSKCWSRLCGYYMLNLYAAFTRLPAVTVPNATEWLEASNPYMITHFDDERATLAYDTGDEDNVLGVNISSNEIRRLPKKYVFVNYHAWQYAGSDTLWAGIVTKLSDAIENEFGSVCVRIFRMLQVERPSKSGPIEIGGPNSEDPRSLYVLFKFPQDRRWTTVSMQERVLFIIKDFGVITECFNYDHSSWWYIRFATDKEAEYADTALRLDNFEVRRKRPELSKMHDDISSSSLQQTGNESQSPLVDEAGFAVYKYQTSRFENTSQGEPQERRTASQPEEARNEARTSSPSCFSKNCRFLSHFRKHPKTVCCGCPFLYCCVFFVIAALLFPITIFILVDHLGLGVMKSARVIPEEVQIFSWMPATIGALVVILRFCWAMCHSQTDRVRKSLAGSRGNMKNALGFMNEVKQEVMIMSRLINCIRFTHGVDYKVVLTIDDLDRCPYHKVKSVLEAVNILLSDRSSPFLCLIAVDSRVAVKCIEQDMGEVLLQANLTGHEYLKKIINLPFCLPEVSNSAKRKYFGGVMDSADETKLVTKHQGRADEVLQVHSKADLLPHFDGGGVDGNNDVSSRRKLVTFHSGTSIDGSHPSCSPLTSVDEEMEARPNIFKDYSEFLFHCRQILNGVGPAGKFIHEYLCGNPRNMKRIFNVLSLTTHLMECIEERRERVSFVTWHREGSDRPVRSSQNRRTSIINSDLSPKKHSTMEFGRSVKDAEDLVKWIVAADQWPYRISYILQVVEDLDRCREAGISETAVDESCTLSEVYEKHVEPEIEANPGAISMLTLDDDPASLRGYLRGCKSLTRGRISSMFHITVNLDQSLRNGISRQRAMPTLVTPTGTLSSFYHLNIKLPAEDALALRQQIPPYRRSEGIRSTIQKRTETPERA